MVAREEFVYLHIHTQDAAEFLTEDGILIEGDQFVFSFLGITQEPPCESPQPY